MRELTKDVIITLFLVALAAIILSPFLFGGKIFLDADVTSYYYSLFDFYSKALKGGESFLWNPLLYSGFPSYVSQTSGFFDPLNRALFGSLDFLTAYHFRLFIDFFLLFFLSYWAGRAWGLSRLASVLIGPSYLSAFSWVYSSNTLVSNTLFLLPLLFLAIRKEFGEKIWSRVGWSLLGGFGIGWAFLAGNAQIIIYTIFLFGIFFVLYFFLGGNKNRNLVSFSKLVSPFLLMVLVGILVGLPQIIPSLQFTPVSARAGGINYSEAVIKGVEPGDLFNFLFPDNLYFPYLAPGRKPLHVGALWFFLAITAFILRKKNKIIALLAVLFTLALLVSFSGSPLFYLLQKLPVFTYFRNPYKWMYVGSFFLAVLGAFGFDLLWDEVYNGRLRGAFKYIVFAIVAMALLFLALNFLGNDFWGRVGDAVHLTFSKALYGNLGFDKNLAHYRDAIGRGITAWREFTSFSNIYFFVSFLSLLAGAGLVLAFLYQRLSWSKFRIFSFGAVLIAFLGTSLGQFSNNVDREPILYSHQKLVDKFIPQEDRNLYRTYPFSVDQGFVERIPPKFKLTLDEQRAFTELRFAAGKPNLNFLASTPSVEGYDPFIPSDLLAVLGIIGSTDSAEEETDRLTLEEKINRLLKNLDVLGMMAGKYIISGVKLVSPDLFFLGELKVSRFSIPLYIYENLKSLPRFYFVKDVAVAPRKSLPQLIQEGRKDFSKRTYLDCASCQGSGRVSSSILKVASQKNGLFEFSTQTSAPSWLVVSESYLPGWAAEIDGTPVKIIRANGFYMAVEVPAGGHRIKFDFRGL